MRAKFSFIVILSLVWFYAISSHASLIDMGDGTIYDSDTQLSWLKDAGVGGKKSWAEAKAWAEGLNIGGLTGWRLPNADPVCGEAIHCTTSEMGHLYYTALGNPNYVLSNTGPFINLQADIYWSGTEVATYPAYSWFFDFSSGMQFDTNKTYDEFAWAVRPGARTLSDQVTSINAGKGLRGDGTTGDVTLDVGAGTGIKVEADTVSVDTNTIQRRVTGACANGAGIAQVNGDGTVICSQTSQKICSVHTNSWGALSVPSTWTKSTCQKYKTLQSGSKYRLMCVFADSFSVGAVNGGIPSPNCGW